MNRLIVITLGIFSTLNVFAQGPPIFTDTPILLGLDGGGVRTFGRIIAKENATIYVHPIAIPYNFSSKFQVGAVAKYINKNPDRVASQSGFGDVETFAKFQLFKKDGKAKTFRVIAKFNQVFPTGKTNVNPNIGNDSWQSQFGFVSGYVTLNYGVYVEIAYNVTSNGLTDNLLYNMAFVYPILPQKYPPNQVNLNIGLNGNLLTDINSNNLLVSSGIQWISGKRLLFETGVQIPIIEDVPDGQKTNFILTLGTRILIF